MSKLVSISLKDSVVLAEVTCKGLAEVTRIPFPEPPKSVVCENGLVVSLVCYGTDCFVHAHKIVDGTAILKWEKLISSEIRYSHIAVKGDVVYLGTFYKPNVPFDPLIFIDFSDSEGKVKSVPGVVNAGLSNILNFRICGSSLYIFENNYPMGVYEYDITVANSPKFRCVRELRISNHLQFVKNFTVSNERMAIIANYNDNLNLSNYLHIYGPKSFTLKSFFGGLYRNEPKYISLRNEMGLLPESVELEAKYSYSYFIRRKVVKPASSVIQAFLSRKMSRHKAFNVRAVSYLTDKLVHLQNPIRIVDLMFNGNILFFIADSKVGYVDFSRDEDAKIKFLQTKIKSPLKLTHARVDGCIIIRSNSEYEMVGLDVDDLSSLKLQEQHDQEELFANNVEC
jgi:hypothetical protein